MNQDVALDQYLEDMVQELDGMATNLQTLGRSTNPVVETVHEGVSSSDMGARLGGRVDNGSVFRNEVTQTSFCNPIVPPVSANHLYDSVPAENNNNGGISEEDDVLTDNSMDYFNSSNLGYSKQDRSQNLPWFSTTPHQRRGDISAESTHSSFGVNQRTQSYVPAQTNTVGRHPQDTSSTSQNALTHIATKDYLNESLSRPVPASSSQCNSRSNASYEDVVVGTPISLTKISHVSNYKNMELENATFNNQATLPYQDQSFPLPPTQHQSFTGQGESYDNDGADRSAFLAVVSVSNDPSSTDNNAQQNNDEELRVEALLGRYPVLRSINEPASADDDGNNNMADKRISTTSCVPPRVNSPTGSIIDATLPIKPERKRRKYQCCEIAMAVCIILAAGAFLIMLVGYLYIGISIEKSIEN